MTDTRLPFFGKSVVASNAPTATGTFGFTWQEVATRIEAFAIEATDTIVEIVNCPHDETRTSLTQNYQRLSSHLFILHPGEYVVKVEVCYTDEAITALKLTTSERVTPWFGDCRGERTTFETQYGYCINALCGKYGPKGCSEVGVVFAPQEMADEGHSIALPTSVVTKLVVLDGAKADAKATADDAPNDGDDADEASDAASAAASDAGDDEDMDDSDDNPTNDEAGDHDGSDSKGDGTISVTSGVTDGGTDGGKDGWEDKKMKKNAFIIEDLQDDPEWVDAEVED